MKTGKTLISDIDTCDVARGACALWWLGQMGFAVKLGGTIAYIDAYLAASDRRQVPPDAVHLADRCATGQQCTVDRLLIGQVETR